MTRRPHTSTLFPYTTLFRSGLGDAPHVRAGGPLPRRVETGRDLVLDGVGQLVADRKSTRLNSSHSQISYAVFCLKKKKQEIVHEENRFYRALESHVHQTHDC